MNVEVRAAQPSDVDAMLRIEAQTFGADAWTREQIGDELDRMGDTRWYAVAADEGAADEGAADGGAADGGADGTVVGYVGLYLMPPDVDIQTITVAQDRQGQGIGQLLLDAALAFTWELGCNRVFLEVRADNTAALALYDRAGFVRLGRRSRYYADGVDAIKMRLRRNEPPPLGGVDSGAADG